MLEEDLSIIFIQSLILLVALHRITLIYNSYNVVHLIHHMLFIYSTESSLPVNACVRCYDVKLSGNFKCGRCGCTFKTKPVNDTTASLPIDSSSSSQLDCKHINVAIVDT